MFWREKEDIFVEEILTINLHFSKLLLELPPSLHVIFDKQSDVNKVFPQNLA